MNKPVILFVYESNFAVEVQDGLWAALEVLKQDFDIHKINMATDKPHSVECSFVLGWGAFNSKADQLIQRLDVDIPTGLCLGGMASMGDEVMPRYDVVFYETEFAFNFFKEKGYMQRFPEKTKFIHAFGVNTDIFWHAPRVAKIFDWLSVGSFSNWKRHHLLKNKTGIRVAIGEIQKGNMGESLDIIANLIIDGVGVMDMVNTQTLGRIYNASRNVYIPGIYMGGGERAVLEARACGVPVAIEDDNPKLKELLTSPIWSHHYYANQLKEGISACLA